MTTMITDPWPLCRAGQIHVKNPKHPTVILTCWTKKDSIIKELEDAGADYNSVGQLYSTRGISPFARNLLANCHIRHVIVTGKDLSGAGAQLIAELEGCTQLTGCSDIPAYKNDPRSLLNSVRRIERDALVGVLQKYPEITTQGGLAAAYPEPAPKTLAYPAADFGHAVTGRTIPEVYLKMLQYILRFGKETATHYDDPQKEVLAMQNIITEHPPLWCHEEDGFRDAVVVPEWMPEDTEHVETYIRERILSGEHWPDLKYTYGELIHDFGSVGDFPVVGHILSADIVPGADYPSPRTGVDQFQLAVDKMVEGPDQRSCVISLWNPHKHTGQKSGTPCLNHIQFRMRDDVLSMHVFIRSNDMYAGWPENAYAMRVLQEEFIYRYLDAKSDCGDVTMGPLCITSMSAHLYRDTWEPAQELVDKYLWKTAKNPWADWDPKGQFEVLRDDDELVVLLTDGEKTLAEWRADSAKAMCNMLVRDGVTDNVSNAMFLSRELQRLEDEV